MLFAFLSFRSSLNVQFLSNVTVALYYFYALHKYKRKNKAQ